MRGPDARTRFVESHLSKGLAFQLRSLRDRESWSQQQLAAKVGMTQNAISRLENPNYGKATLTTLKRIAAAFDVALVVRFEPFSRLVGWVSGTPYTEQGMSPESLAVPSFASDPGIFPATAAQVARESVETALVDALKSKSDANCVVTVVTLSFDPQLPRYRAQREEFNAAISGSARASGSTL